MNIVKGTLIIVGTLVVSFVLACLPVLFNLNDANHSLMGVLVAFVLMIGGTWAYSSFRGEDFL